MSASITAAYGRLTPSQYQLVAKVSNGADVRYYHPGINHTVARSLMERRILDCEATTCRFRLLPAEQAVVKPLGKRRV